MTLLLMVTAFGPGEARGDFYLNPSLTLDGSYDTNFFSKGENSHTSDDEDYVLTASPAIQLQHQYKNYSADLNYGYNYRYFSKTEKTKEDWNSGGSFALLLPWSQRLSFQFNDSFSYTEETFDTKGDSESESIISVNRGIETKRTGRLDNAFSTAMSFAVTPKFSSSLSINESHTLYRDESRIDTRSDRGGLSFSYSPTAILSFNWGYGYSNYSFDAYDYTFDTTQGENIASHSGDLGVSRQLTPQLSADLSGGVVYSEKPVKKTDWTGQFGLSHQLKTSSLNLKYNRSQSDTAGLLKETSINQTLSARWNIQLSERLTMNLNGSGSKNLSQQTGSIETTSYSTGFSLAWIIKKWLHMNLGYDHSQQWSGGTVGQDLSRDRVHLSLSALPQGWRL